jgi:four helix bundle protein
MVKFSALFESKSKFAIANQIIRSGTSTGANVGESQHAESKSDFIHKMKVPAKETDETEYWLLIASQSEYYPNCDDLLTKILSIIKGSVKDYWHINGWL